MVTQVASTAAGILELINSGEWFCVPKWSARGISFVFSSGVLKKLLGSELQLTVSVLCYSSHSVLEWALKSLRTVYVSNIATRGHLLRFTSQL